MATKGTAEETGDVEGVAKKTRSRRSLEAKIAEVDESIAYHERRLALARERRKELLDDEERRIEAATKLLARARVLEQVALPLTEGE